MLGGLGNEEIPANITPMSARRFLRMASLGLLALFFMPVMVAIIGEFFIEWAKQGGWYANPSERVGAVIALANTLISTPWFQWLVFSIGGFAIGVWVDYFTRRRENKQEWREADENIKRLILSMADLSQTVALWHIYGKSSERANDILAQIERDAKYVYFHDVAREFLEMYIITCKLIILIRNTVAEIVDREKQLIELGLTYEHKETPDKKETFQRSVANIEYAPREFANLLRVRIDDLFEVPYSQQHSGTPEKTQPKTRPG